MTGQAWVIVQDNSGGPWPDQVGECGPPGASDLDVEAARIRGQEFRVVNYDGKACYLGRVHPDASVLAEGFIVEDGRPAVDPDVADLVEVLDRDEWVNIWDYLDPSRAGG